MSARLASAVLTVVLGSAVPALGAQPTASDPCGDVILRASGGGQTVSAPDPRNRPLDIQSLSFSSVYEDKGEAEPVYKGVDVTLNLCSPAELPALGESFEVGWGVPGGPGNCTDSVSVNNNLTAVGPFTSAWYMHTCPGPIPGTYYTRLQDDLSYLTDMRVEGNSITWLLRLDRVRSDLLDGIKPGTVWRSPWGQTSGQETGVNRTSTADAGGAHVHAATLHDEAGPGADFTVGGSASADTPDPIDIRDIAGDANALVEDTTTPVSYEAADLVSVDLQTTYVSVPVGEDGIDYQPKDLRVVFETSASPMDLQPGTQLVYRLEHFSVPGGATVFIEGVVSKSPTGSMASLARLRQESSQCDPQPDRCWAESKPEWTAQINASEKTLTLTFPFSSLIARERLAIGVGAIIRHPEASTFDSGTDSAAQNAVEWPIDTAPFGHGYVVAAEVPEDVECTQECERVPLPCYSSAGWSDNGRIVRFFAGGDEACESSADLGGVKLTVTARRCPSGSPCTDTQVVKVCPGRRCVADVYLPYEKTETASYKTIAKWEFGDGRVFEGSVSGLCHNLSPMEDCPETGSAHKEFFTS